MWIDERHDSVSNGIYLWNWYKVSDNVDFVKEGWLSVSW